LNLVHTHNHYYTHYILIGAISPALHGYAVKQNLTQISRQILNLTVEEFK